MKEAHAHRDETIEEILGQVADEFSERLQRGERPDIEEYARANPRISAIIREVFPSLIAMSTAVDVLPVGEPDADQTGTPVAGVLGDYRLIREIGRGGMGIVYEAEQISLGRRVALKVLSFAAVLDPRQLQRFKNEAQAAAQLHHTHIVPVFAVGCDRGVHYYAMQYIDGHPLSAVIEELRQLASLPPLDDRPVARSMSGISSSLVTGGWLSNRAYEAGSSAGDGLGTLVGSGQSAVTFATDTSVEGRAFHESIANLGIQAADALQHAHERGVIHRDIKPSNLLLDASGRLWVTDFGLAVMQTDTGLTLTGDLLGTVRYMSPEQALAKRVPVDHRTDVYSLGVTLYELLALEPAFNGRDRQELLRQIALEEARPLRRVRRSIPAELETIVGKAMAKNPEDRYATAGELADDLRRYVEDRPIMAKPPSLLDLGAKWARRHRSAVGATAALLILSLVGLLVGTVLIAHERAEAVRQRDAAYDQRRQAEANLQLAGEVVDRMLTHVAAAELANIPSREGLRRALLEDASKFSDGLLADKSPEPAVRRNAATAHVRLAQINAQIGQDAAAEEAYREAIRILATLCRDVPGVPAHHAQLADTQFSLATLLWEKRRCTEAEILTREGQAQIRQALQGEPKSWPFRNQLARGFDLTGLVCRDTDRIGEAEESLRESLMLRRELLEEARESSEGAQYRLEQTRTQRNLADVLMKTGRRAEAEAVIRDILVSQEDLVNWFPDNPVYAAELSHTRRWWDEVLRLVRHQASNRAQPDPARLETEAAGYSKTLADTYRTLSEALKRTGKAEDADAAYRRAVGIIEELVRECPTNPKYREDLAQLHRLQAGGLKSRWEVDAAAKTLSLAVDIERGLVEEYPDRPDYAKRLDADLKLIDDLTARRSVAELVLSSKRSAEGVGKAVELALVMDASRIPDDPLLLSIVAEHLALGDAYDRAEVLIRRAVELDPGNAARHKTWGWILLGQGRREEARAEFGKVLSLLNIEKDEQAAGACPDPCTAGYFLDKVGRERFVQRWQGILMLGLRLDSWPWFFIGMRMELEGRLDEAKAAYRKCEELGRLANTHHTGHWGTYRLGKLIENERVASNRR